MSRPFDDQVVEVLRKRVIELRLRQIQVNGELEQTIKYLQEACSCPLNKRLDSLNFLTGTCTICRKVHTGT